MLKKSLSLFMAVCMILSVFSCVTVSASETGSAPVVTLTRDNVSVTNVSGTYWLMLASYDDNGLVDAKKIQISEDYQSSITDTGLNIEGATSMKAMIWESLENIKAVTGDTKFDMNAVYTVSFDANGGTGAAVEALTGKWGEKIVLPESELTKKGYTFAGWILGSDLYLPGEEFTITTDAEFTASWVADGEEFKVNFEETIYFGTSANGAETGTVKRNTTVQGNLFRNFATSAYYAKIDVDKYTDISAAYLNLYMTKFNNRATITVYDVAEEDYVAAFNGVENNTEFAVANLPGGEKITEKSYDTTSSGYFYAAPIDITDYIAAKDAEGVKYAYIMLKNTASGNATTDAARVYNFYEKSYVNVIGAVAPKATFAVNNEAGDEIAPVYGKTVILPECTYINGDYDFIGWSDGVDVYQAGAEYTMPGDKEFTAVWGYVAYASFTTTDPGVVGTIDVVNVEKGDTLVLPSTGMTKPSKVGSWELYGWNDGSAVYPVGTEYVMDDHANFTPVWVYTGVESTTIDFDEKKIVTAGKWIPTYDETGAENGGAYDNTIQSVANASGTAVSVNVRKTYGSSNGYRVRPFVYVSVDLVNEVPAESVVLNINAASSNGAVYVQKVDHIPAVGDENATGTSLGNVSAASGKTLDITEAYNESIGSTLYLKVYGWAWADKKAQNYVTLDADNLKLTISSSAARIFTVTFDNGADEMSVEENTVITLPDCTATEDGKVFAGWSDGTATYEAGSQYTVTAPVEFTAVFANAISVTYNNCDEEGTVVYPEGKTLELPTPVKSSDIGTYVFAGWYDGTTTYPAGTEFVLANNLSFTALWTFEGLTGGKFAADETIGFVCTTAAGSISSESVGTLTLNPKSGSVRRSNYNTWAYYIKFNISELRNVITDSASFNFILTSENTSGSFGVQTISEAQYNAVRSKIEEGSTTGTMTVGDVKDGTQIGRASITKGNTNVTKTYDVSSYIENLLAEGEDYLYIRFTKVNQSKDENGGDKAKFGDLTSVDNAWIETSTSNSVYAEFEGAETIAAIAGTEITLPAAPEVERGKVFTGWTDGATTYEAGATYTLNATTTFKAVIVDGIVFDYVKDSESTYETYLPDSVIALPTIESDKEGYAFAGWTTDGGETILAAGSEYTVTADATLTAVYTKRLDYTDWYLYYGDSNKVTNFNQGSHTLGRNNGSKLFTTLDISGLDTDAFKATFYFQYSNMKNGYTYLNIYPVVGDYDTVFAGIEYNTTSAEAVDISGLTFGTRIGQTGKEENGPYYKTDASVTLEYTLPNVATYLETQRAAGATEVKLAYWLTSGNATTDGLRMYNNSSHPAYIKLYVLAGAEAITPAE